MIVRSRREALDSPLLVGGASLGVMLIYFGLSGALLPGDVTGFWMTSIQSTGLALTYATSPAFMLGALVFTRHQTRTSLDQLVHSGCLAPDIAASCDVGGQGIGAWQNLIVTLIGLFLGSLNVAWPITIESLGGPWMWTSISLGVGNLVTWLVVVHVVHRRVLVSNAIRRLGRDHVEVDLLRPDALLPIGRIGILHLLIVAIALSLSAFQSLDAELRWDNYQAALAAAIPAGSLLLLLPMLGVRQNLRAAKAHALAKLDEAIVHADRELEPDPLHYLGDLLRQRDIIRSVREWPLDTTGVSRIAIYFIIPPIAWVGGALVEILLESAL